MIRFMLPPPSPCLLWAFTDSRICYRVFLGNNSSLFTVSAGGTIASHSVNSFFFFFPVCLVFSIFNLPSCLHFQSTGIFQLLGRQTSVCKDIKGVQDKGSWPQAALGALFWCLSDGTSPAKGYSSSPLHYNPWGEGDEALKFNHL